MRTIVFRAKGDDEQTKDRWFHGSYYQTDDTIYCFKEDYDAHPDNTKHYILFDESMDWGLPNRKLQASIDPNTLGQYTGRVDKNGKRVFEGDIVKAHDILDDFDFIGCVEFENCSFVIVADDVMLFYRWTDYEVEVIGNIYDNPELLEVQDD